jgi:hypothetical protein
MWLSVHAPNAPTSSSTNGASDSRRLQAPFRETSVLSTLYSREEPSTSPACQTAHGIPISVVCHPDHRLNLGSSEEQASTCVSREVRDSTHSVTWDNPDSRSLPPHPPLTMHGLRYVDCVLGALPMQMPLNGSDCGLRASVPLLGEPSRRLQWSSVHCDQACGPWCSFLLLMSDGVGVHERDVLFPNQVFHHGRSMHNVTEQWLLHLVSDPLLSEVCSPWLFWQLSA